MKFLAFFILFATFIINVSGQGVYFDGVFFQPTFFYPYQYIYPNPYNDFATYNNVMNYYFNYCMAYPFSLECNDRYVRPSFLEYIRQTIDSKSDNANVNSIQIKSKPNSQQKQS